MLYFYSKGGSTVGNMVIVKQTSIFDFLSRVSIVTRDIDIANVCLSVRPSVRPSVRNIPVSDENGLTYVRNGGMPTQKARYLFTGFCGK